MSEDHLPPVNPEPLPGEYSALDPQRDDVGVEQRVFVYGTLRRGWSHPMAKFLADRARFLGEGTVRGTLVNLGSYPGLSIPGETAVRGDLYEFPAESASDGIARLDAYEGCSPGDPLPHEYRKATVDVLLADGTTRPASVYLLNSSPAPFETIDSGDYLAWRRRRT